jgi:hypothetical protein
MFGFIVANKEALTQQQLERYRGCYCGLCRALSQHHGLIGKMTLNYDMTFLVLLLSSLYEPQDSTGWSRCFNHPDKRYSIWQNKFTDYAADMNIALSYYKCVDDWRDEHRLDRLCGSKLLESRYKKVMLQYPRQCRCIEECFTKLAEIEKTGCRLPDAAPNCFGQLMGCLLTYYDDDHWTETLKRTGTALGKFIYAMDACLDLETDRKHRSYNPLLTYTAASENDGFYELLTMLIGDCTLEFEKLPLVQDVAIMRNILYSGVWQKYQIKARKTAKRGDNK